MRNVRLILALVSSCLRIACRQSCWISGDLIEGSRQQVIAFLDRLTYGVRSDSEWEQIRTQ